MGDSHPKHKLAVGRAQGPRRLEILPAHVGYAGQRGDGDGKPGAEGDYEHRAAEEGACNHHYDRYPCRSGYGAKELDYGIKPVARPL